MQGFVNESSKNVFPDMINAPTFYIYIYGVGIAHSTCKKNSPNCAILVPTGLLKHIALLFNFKAWPKQ